MGGSVVPTAIGGAVDVVLCVGGVNLGMGGSVRPKPGGGVGGGGKRLRGACAPSGGGMGVRNGFAPLPFGAAATPIGGGVGVPAGIGTTGMLGEGPDPRDDAAGGPSGARAGGGGNAPAAPALCGLFEGEAPYPAATAGGGGSVDAGVA
jgi:hypothetical protein